jgi:hypothetical protein
VIHRDYPSVPVFFITQYLQISPPPKSLRNKVEAELTEKYAAKDVAAEPAAIPPEDEEGEQTDDDRSD